MNNKKPARRPGSRNVMAVPLSNSETELTLGNSSTFSPYKTDSMSEHSLASQRPSKHHQSAHSHKPPVAEKGAIGDGVYQPEKKSTSGIHEDKEASQENIDDAEVLEASASINVQQADFTDPVFQKLSRLNGQINRLHKDQLRQKLAELHLRTGGVKEVLKKRLKTYYKRKKLIAANINKEMEVSRHDFLVVIDYEATCQEKNDRFTQEIIEFPAVLIDVKERKFVGMFREFCKPKLNPLLTEFCKQLTGVNQSEVDNASEFPVVLENFEQWLNNYELGSKYTFCVITDGPWDIQRFLSQQCEISRLPIPVWARKWVNIRKTFCNFYATRRLNLKDMLTHLGLEFDGRPHCGLDDSKNIARIVCQLLEDGCPIKPNEKLVGFPSTPQPKDCVETGDGNPSGDLKPLQTKSSPKDMLRNDEVTSTIKTKKSVKELAGLESDEEVSDLLNYFSLRKT